MAQSHRSPTSVGGEPARVTGWVGWVFFAAVIMFTTGFVNIIEGFVALVKDDYYQVRPSGLVVHVDYTAWGWTLLVFGVVLAVVGDGGAIGQTWARVTGRGLAVLNPIVNLGFIAAYPL